MDIGYANHPTMVLRAYDPGANVQRMNQDGVNLAVQHRTPVNANSYTFFTKDLTSLFYPMPDDPYEPVEQSQKTWLNWCESARTKALWRPIDFAKRINNSDTWSVVLNFKYNTAEWYNCGLEPLNAGDLVYCLPPYYPAVKTHSSTHFFTHDNKIYMWPMLMSMGQKLRFEQDVRDACRQGENWNYMSAGSVLGKKLTWNVMNKLYDFMIGLKPAGRVEVKQNVSGKSTVTDPAYDTIALNECFRIRFDLL